MTPAVIALRRAEAHDLRVLETMLFEAFHWRPDVPPPSRAAFARDPEFRKLLAGWGERAGDLGVIALDRGEPVGAAFYRYWTPELHSYGFIENAIPELAMGVRADARSRGLGRALLERLIVEARGAGAPGISLSVEPDNYARHLYESLGFRKVGSEGGSDTMLLQLLGDEPSMV